MDFLHWLLQLIRNPGPEIQQLGYLSLALIIFLETGAMVFFLPGDSLLVAAGIYMAHPNAHLSLWLVNLLLIPAAIIGDAVSYHIGAKAGPHIFNRERSRFFNPAHLRTAHDFYERHGGKAIILARFMPILRTFVPVVAGVAQMTYVRFASYNVIGAAAWVLSMTFTGYFLGSLIPGLDRHIEKVIIVVVLLSISPGIIEYLRHRRRSAGA
jgi:membrane-associated protein